MINSSGRSLGNMRTTLKGGRPHTPLLGHPISRMPTPRSAGEDGGRGGPHLRDPVPAPRAPGPSSLCRVEGLTALRTPSRPPPPLPPPSLCVSHPPVYANHATDTSPLSSSAFRMVSPRRPACSLSIANAAGPEAAAFRSLSASVPRLSKRPYRCFYF